MFKYGPRRNFKTKYNHEINKSDNSNYIKMYNLELESINSNTFLKLQNRIGNQATEQLLEQLSMTEITKNTAKHNEVRLSPDENKPYNKSNQANSEMDSYLKAMTDSYSNQTSDILKRDMLYKENRQNGRLGLNSESIYYIIHKLDELSTILKNKDFDTENKELEVKNADKMLDTSEKTAVADVDFILVLISKLHKYNEDESTIKDYMKTINLLSNTGINLIDFLSKNNDINEQKRMLYKALGAVRAAE